LVRVADAGRSGLDTLDVSEQAARMPATSVTRIRWNGTAAE
jgi:hypothetical protein